MCKVSLLLFDVNVNSVCFTMFINFDTLIKDLNGEKIVKGIQKIIEKINEITLPLVAGSYELNKLDDRIEVEEIVIFVESMYYDMCLKLLVEDENFNKKQGTLCGVSVLLREIEDFEAKTSIKLLSTRKVCDSEYYHVLNAKQYLSASECMIELRLTESQRKYLIEYIETMQKEVEGYKFLPVEKGEEKKVKELYRQVIKTTLTTWDEEYPSMEMIEDDIKNKELYCLKDSRGKIMGVCFISDKFEGEEDWKEEMIKPYRFARICSLPSLQGFGIATKMMKEIIAYAKARGSDGFRISVYDKNISALKLYSKFGFNKVGESFKYGFNFYLHELKF